MARRYDTYGFGTLTLDDARRLVEERLRLDLEPRESGYYADRIYTHKIDSDRRLRLYRNLDAWGGSIKPPFVDHAVILDVSNLDDMDGVRRRLTEGHDEPVLLTSREVIDDEVEEEA